MKVSIQAGDTTRRQSGIEPDSELTAAAHEAVRIFLESFSQLEGRPVDPRPDRAELQTLLSGKLQQPALGPLAAIREFESEVIPNSLAMPHPLYCGLLNNSPLPTAPLVDLLVSALNNNSGAFRQGPFALAAEKEILREFSQLCFGHGEAGGMLLPGGSYANLQGLVLARQKHFPEWTQRGPGAAGTPRIYVSQASHFSALRAAIAIGLGVENVRSVPVDARGQMETEILAEAIRRDREEGDRPFAVVATAGTTGIGAIDPLNRIGQICHEQKLWLHVDACFGAAVLLLPERAELLSGINQADSIAIDPHKWFFMPLTTSLLLVRDPEIELELFDVAARYVPEQTSEDGFRRGLPTSRRASSLTLWTTLRAHGWEAIREGVRRNIHLTRRLEQLLRAGGFEVCDNLPLSVAAARWTPKGWEPRDVDDLQARIAQRAVESGRAWFSTVGHQQKVWLRFNLVNLHVREQHMEQLAEIALEEARKSAAN